MGERRLRARAHNEGFSLIELLVVVALMALVAVFALPSITSSFKIGLSTAARELATTIKEAYHSTVATGHVHRVVYDIKSGTYWVEQGGTTALLDTKETLEAAERKKKFSKDDKPKESPFSLAKSVTRKKKSLPRGIAFEDIVTQQSPDPLTEGTAYTHMFPHGLTEKTVIHLVDNSDHKASLIVSPLVGRTDLYERYVSAQEAFEKK